MNKKFMTIIFIIAMLIFLPVSFYLIQNNTISLLTRNIIFGVLIGLYLLGINVFLKDNKS